MKFDLNRLLYFKKEELLRRKSKISLGDLEDKIKSQAAPPNFKTAISKRGNINVIAEIKHQSPSEGVIVNDFNVERIAKAYAEGGASAISVLTEKNYFGGDLSNMETAGRISGLPVLRKDFIVDHYEICEARAYGAGAVLLIVKILDKVFLREAIVAAGDYGLDVLVEAHNEKEIDTALSSGSRIIGINSRDLATLEVDKGAPLRLAPLIPDGYVIVAESGISCIDDIKALQNKNIAAVLVGTWLLRQKNPAESLRALKKLQSVETPSPYEKTSSPP